MAISVLIAEASGRLVRSRPRFVWVDGVKVALCSKDTTVKVARQYANDRIEWRTLVKK